MQWRVLSLGLKHADSQFQRMMEWVRVFQTAIPYINDVLIGSTGNTVEEMVPAQNQDVCVVLTAPQAEQLVCNTKKSYMEVNLCGY